MPNSTFHDLRVWQEAMDFTEEIYRVTINFPKPELYGLTSQMWRAAVSVPSNIAEGKGHRSDPEFVRFLFHARGLCSNLRRRFQLRDGYNTCQRKKPRSFVGAPMASGVG
jgi:four helix bundle protein